MPASRFTLPDNEQQELRELIGEMGLEAAAREIGASAAVTANAAAGGRLHRGNLLLVSVGLEHYRRSRAA